MSNLVPTEMKRVALASRPDGRPSTENFRLETVPLRAPQDGEFVVRVIYLSLDPYMRGRMDAAKSYSAPVEIGETMEGGAVGEVIASRNSRFNVGDIVTGMFGWASHAVSDGTMVRKLDPSLAPVSTSVGVLGMPGITAWVGLNVHGKPKAGETLVVGAATGAVGSVVGQLGKIAGLRVIGVAGGAEKCSYAVEELGFDACIDHHADNLKARLAEACPDGVDIYYENVGGATLEAVMPLMNVGGRIPLCGMIAWYDKGGLGAGASEGPNLLPKMWRTILVQRLTVRGFIVTDHYDHFPAFLAEVSGYLRDGRLKYRESFAEGLENAPDAFLSMLQGGNFGKQLVRVSEDPTL